MPDSDLYLDKNTCSLTALALSPSVLFSQICISTGTLCSLTALALSPSVLFSQICISTGTLCSLTALALSPSVLFSEICISTGTLCSLTALALSPSVLFSQICISTGTLCSLTALALSPSVLFSQICISTGTLVPSLHWHFLHQFCFILFSVKIIWKSFHHSFQKNSERSYFAAEIQALLWTAQEFSAETTQSTIQNLILQQQEVTRFTHWAYSGLENKQTTKHV